MRKLIFSLTLILSFGVVWAKSDKSAKSPESSLNSCQDAVRKEAQKFIHKKMDAIGRCLQDVSKQIVKKNELDASGAAKSCVRRFSKIDDLEAKLIEKINKKCDPSQEKVTHTLEDILGAGAGVLEPLEATNLNAYCANFGGPWSGWSEWRRKWRPLPRIRPRLPKLWPTWLPWRRPSREPPMTICPRSPVVRPQEVRPTRPTQPAPAALM